MANAVLQDGMRDSGHNEWADAVDRLERELADERTRADALASYVSEVREACDADVTLSDLIAMVKSVDVSASLVRHDARVASEAVRETANDLAHEMNDFQANMLRRRADLIAATVRNA